MKIITIFIVCVYQFAIASSDSKTLALPDFSGLKDFKEKSKINFSIDCEDEIGHEIKKGESGYESCFRAKTNKKSNKKTSLNF